MRVWQALVFGFAGVRFEGDAVVTDAKLPAHWRRLAFRIVHRGRTVDVDLRAAPQQIAEPAVRGLIFDLDGVITDTAEAHYRAWQRLADEEGLPFDRRANDALRGISRRELLRLVLGARAVTDAEAETLMARKNGYYRDLVATMSAADVLPGAIGVLEAARARGLRMPLGRRAGTRARCWSGSVSRTGSTRSVTATPRAPRSRRLTCSSPPRRRSACLPMRAWSSRTRRTGSRRRTRPACTRSGSDGRPASGRRTSSCRTDSRTSTSVRSSTRSPGARRSRRSRSRDTGAAQGGSGAAQGGTGAAQGGGSSGR